MSLTEAKIAKFLTENVKPLKDNIFGDFYRASAYLRDGTYLPCVVFSHPAKLIDLAIRRFAETAKDDSQHRLVAGSFVASRSAVPIYNVSSVELSPYAWPEEVLRQIHGETTMGWTSFTAKMKDGKVFGFGTPFNFEFFDLPKGYGYGDIVEIHSGMIVDEDGMEKVFSHDWLRECYRDRPFFYCYTECLSEPKNT
jgi:hypothetical protein